jgi:hypothetical protein
MRPAGATTTPRAAVATRTEQAAQAQLQQPPPQQPPLAGAGAAAPPDIPLVTATADQTRVVFMWPDGHCGGVTTAAVMLRWTSKAASQSRQRYA